jgi:hypothetical protein
MALRVIKQGETEKGGSILWTYTKTNKLFLALSIWQFVDHFFQVGLQPYLQIATLEMKRDTLFEHKEVAVTCEKKWETPMNIKNCWNHQPSRRRLAKGGKHMWSMVNVIY